MFPGETLIVHLDNAMTGLTIRDFFDPAYTAKGEEVPSEGTRAQLDWGEGM